MWSAERIEKLVPYLRRYARATTGEVHSADGCVELVLKRLIEQSLQTTEDLPSMDRMRLFKMLDEELNALASSKMDKARRAFFLIAVEDLPKPTVRQILGVSLEELESLLILAESDFSTSLATSLLIIEDEPLISSQLKRLAESQGHKVVGIASTANEAITISKAQSLDLVLCDINLADGSQGTDAINGMNIDDRVPVVYITAYPEKYLSRSNKGPSYLITKPFDPDYCKAVIGHALKNAERDQCG
nr:response regulator [Hyphomonas sp. Mor2]